ncbi:Potassium voltage-gated channel sub S member 3 [Thoreauomyces humboldtii]|nr:Potassium voltage-gated channel sub S member 3 [Thoreauomyces humboldtii]
MYDSSPRRHQNGKHRSNDSLDYDDDDDDEEDDEDDASDEDDDDGPGGAPFGHMDTVNSTDIAHAFSMNVPPVSPSSDARFDDLDPSLKGRCYRILVTNKWIGRFFTAALLVSLVTMCLGTVDYILIEPRRTEIVYSFEATCLSIFTLELFLEIVLAPNMLRATLQWQRLIDVLTIMPFYIDIGRATISNRPLYETTYAIEGGAWVRVLDLCRLLRLFRLFPKSGKLRMMGRAFSQSLDGLWLLFILLPLLTLLFSVLLFYSEQTGEFFNEKDRLWHYDENHSGGVSPFQSIPDCFWFTLVTLTTIGYGDVVPRTTAGRILASGLMVTSLFLVAFPLTMITSQYTLVANRYAEKRALLRMQRAERLKRQRGRRRKTLLARIASTSEASIVDRFKDTVQGFKERVATHRAGSVDDDTGTGSGGLSLAFRRTMTAPETSSKHNSNNWNMIRAPGSVTGWVPPARSELDKGKFASDMTLGTPAVPGAQRNPADDPLGAAGTNGVGQGTMSAIPRIRRLSIAAGGNGAVIRPPEDQNPTSRTRQNSLGHHTSSLPDLRANRGGVAENATDPSRQPSQQTSETRTPFPSPQVVPEPPIPHVPQTPSQPASSPTPAPSHSQPLQQPHPSPIPSQPPLTLASSAPPHSPPPPQPRPTVITLTIEPGLSPASIPPNTSWQLMHANDDGLGQGLVVAIRITARDRAQVIAVVSALQGVLGT